MDSFHRHVLICDPEPTPEELERWREVATKTAASIMRVNSPRALFVIANDLGHILDYRTTGDNVLATHAREATGDATSTQHQDDNPLYWSISAMLAVREMLAREGDTKRGVAGVATWSTLSFAAPLPQPRLEALRNELLLLARRKAFQMASRARRRSDKLADVTGASSSSNLVKRLKETLASWRKNEALDQEEITLLRWLLADKCEGFQTPFRDISSCAAAALAMGIELGQLLSHFPAQAHWQLAAHFVTEPHCLNLPQLLDSVRADRARLAAMLPHPSLAPRLPQRFSACPRFTRRDGARPCGGNRSIPDAVVPTRPIGKRSGGSR